MLTAAEIFRDKMVLQRGKNVPVWGKGTPGRTVSVRIQKQEKKAVADADGSWTAVFDCLQKSLQETMVITDGQETVEYRDVAIGEVWFAGGQSNMEYLMGFDEEFGSEKQRFTDRIRFYSCPKVSWEGELERYDYSRYGFWRECTCDDLKYFPAVPYYFSLRLQEALEEDVPIGIIDCTWGGSRAACWMTEEAILESGGKTWLDEYEAGLKTTDADAEEEEYRNNPMNAPTDPFRSEFECRVLYPGLSREEQEVQLKEMKTEEARARENGHPAIIGRCHPWRPAGLYYTMLEKVIPYAVRGIIYYQGESDASHADLYEKMLTGLIRLWRKKWGEDLPFLMVQLAPFGIWYEETGKNYPQIRQAQQNVADQMPGVWLASNGDAGMKYDIHPKRKRPAGTRLALLALNHVYGENIISDAPRCVGAVLKDRVIELSFSDVKKFIARGETIHAFQIFDGCKELPSEEYGVELPEENKEPGNVLRIILKHPSGNPKVKFAYTDYYEVNLYNEAMLPALPFEMEAAVEI